MSNKVKTNKNLSEVEGTVAYAVANNKDTINAICISNKSLKDAKIEVITLIENNSNDCESRTKIILSIAKCKSKYDMLLYMYNTLLAGDNLAVI